MPWPDAPDMEPGDVISILGADHVFYEDTMRTGGSLSWNNQNPGNITRSQEAESYGAYPGKHNDIFAVFPSEETGFEAVRRYLARRGDKTITEAMHLYAPAKHGSNDPDAYAQRIAASLGVGTDTTLAGLDDAQLTAFASAIQQVEGWRGGRTHGPHDLPAHVTDWLAAFPGRAERTAADQPFARRGTVAEGVKNIQRRLNELGCDPPLDVDGNFGPRTEAAARWFQTNSGLSPDGIVGNKTWRRLMEPQE
ncbi:peptidoglycan-binding protein [Streptomyces pseudogriseolus]|uniref:peptidoglycan-binding protein n=1 Tax=Streptomyces pseudogriseolus TaxID=36817 RepID=UPI001CE39859|nr:peptidoglycan-binding protein [Streptomyces pseudogriseolus]